MRIYTRTGDAGQTGLIGGARTAKDSLRMEAIGQVDELNSSLGLARLHARDSLLHPTLEKVQSWLFDLGGMLAAPTVVDETLGGDQVRFLENDIDVLEKGLKPLRNFILPGGSALAAHLHHSRTICRRAERVIVSLAGEEGVRPEALAFMNRLSDWLFVAARTANAAQNVEDVLWRRQEANQE